MNIENTLEAKQKLVNGWIEVVSVTDDILLVCNEEGKLENLPPNLLFDYDYIAGDCFLVGDDFENGDFRSLTDEEIEDKPHYTDDDYFLKSPRIRKYIETFTHLLHQVFKFPEVICFNKIILS